MAIVTISRGSFSRGKEVAEKLAEKLSYTCTSRDILLETCEDFSIPEIRLEKALHDAPSILDRFSYGRDRYISCFRSVFLNHMKKDNVVYHGLAGHFFLSQVTHAFKVRIIANIESRVEAEVAREGISEKEARYRLKKDDEERRKWGLALYGRDTGDSNLYDMVINVDTVTLDDVVSVLADIVQKGRFDATEESQRYIEEQSMIANIHAEFVKISPKVGVTIKDGVLTLSNLDGYLIFDSEKRRETSRKIIEEHGLKEVLFSGPTAGKKDHVNTFYNLDI